MSAGTATVDRAVRPSIASATARARSAVVTRARGRLLAARPYLATFMVSSLVVSRWFRSGTFISTGDMGSFLRDGWVPEATSSWNHVISGAGSAGYTVGRGFEILLIDAVRLAGGNEYVAQWLFYTLIYGLVAVGTAYAARALVTSELAAVTAGTFAILNGFFLTRLPNPLNIISVGSIALLTGLGLRVAKGRSLGAPWAGIALLPTSFLGFNPPMLVVAYAWAVAGIPLLVLAMMGRSALWRLLRWMAAALPWALLLNAFWIVPLALSYVGGGGAAGNADFTDPTAWAWSQAQNQVPNVMTFVANWAWVKPQYLPFAADLDRPWIVWVRYLIPTLMFLGPVLAPTRLRRPAVMLVAFSLAFVVLAKGLQPPFASFNLFLYNHVPGFWLFREPMSKLGQLMVIFVALLLALVVQGTLESLRRRPGRASVLRSAGVLGAVVAVVAYPYPLWTGAVIPDVRPQQPSAHVRVPQFWHAMADRLNADKRPGKVLVLPLDDYYQMPTTWGFSGVDSIANLLIQHPVVQPKPDGYFSEAPSFGAEVRAVQTALVTGDLQAVPQLLRATQVSRIIVRHDLLTGLPNRSFANGDQLAAALARVPGVSHAATDGQLELWQLGDGSLPTVATYGRLADSPARPQAVADAIATLPADQAVVPRASDPGTVTVTNDPRSVQTSHDVIQWPVPAVDSGNATTSVTLPTTDDWTVGQRSVAAPALVPSVRPSGRGGELVLHDPSRVTVDGTTVSTRPDTVVPVARPDVVAVTAGPRTVSLDGWGRSDLPGSTTAAMLLVGSATPVTAWAPSTKPARPASPSAVYDCDNYHPRPASELGLRLQKLQTAEGTTLRLSARDHAACTRIEVPDARAGRTYRVRMQFRTVTGKRPEVCLWQLGTDGCTLAPRAPITDAWTTYEQFVTVDTVATGLQIVLYANVGVRLGDPTVTEYRHISIEALDPVTRATVFPAEVPATRVHLTAGTHTLAVVGGPSGSILQPFGPLEDCYNTDDSGFDAAGLSATKLAAQKGPAYRLTAKDHRACIAAAVPDMGNSSLYELSFDARSVNLRDPRVCLYQRGPDRCTPIPTGGPWKNWTTYRVLVSPDPTSVETRLYLYGLRDLAGQNQAVVEYRAVALRPIASPVDVTLVRDQASAPAATTTWTQQTPTRVSVNVSGATPMGTDGSGTALAFYESYAPGWRAESAQGLTSSAGPKVQGWMNGWVASAPEVSASLFYGPEKIAHLVLLLFPVMLLAALVWLLVRRQVRSRVSSGFHRPTRGRLGSPRRPREVTA